MKMPKHYGLQQHAPNELSVPQEIRSTGVRRGILEDLALKILYLQGELWLVELAEQMCLGLGVVEEIFHFFRREQLCEVKGLAFGSHRIVASTLGKQRAAGLLTLNPYTGPAPVSLADYCARIRAQSIKYGKATSEDLARAFRRLVLEEYVTFQIGTALTSGTSLFLYGPSGTGKTSLATALASVFDDSVWVPYAVEVEGQIIAVYDPAAHPRSNEAVPEEHDRRWILCKRPCVITGGELSGEMLDLQQHPVSHLCAAPLHMKANNGIFVLDDFGRQRMRPHELFNRWMTPLDRRLDFLTLPGGKKFEIPFDPLVVFATNLNPLDLADAAFLRRIPNKIRMGHATKEQFLEILRRECEEVRKIPAEPGVYDYVVHQIVDIRKQPLAQCYPRDLLDHIVAASRYLNARPQLTKETADWACTNYFVSTGEDPV